MISWTQWLQKKNRALAVNALAAFLAGTMKDQMGVFMLQPALRGTRCMASQFDVDKCCHYEKLHKFQQKADFVGFLKELFVSSQKCQVLKAWFVDMLSAIASAIDASLTEGDLPAVPAEFPSLRGKTRLRRMDDNARIGHMVGEAPVKRRRTGKKESKAQAASKLEADVRTTMSHYLCAGNDEMAGQLQLSISTDASGLSRGEDTSIAACYSHAVDSSLWLPCQVPSLYVCMYAQLLGLVSSWFVWSSSSSSSPSSSSSST